MNKLRVRTADHILKGCCVPVATRLLHIIAELDEEWREVAPKPAWRINQDLHPEGWTVQRQESEDPGRNKWYSQIAYHRCGLVGVDIKSHQSGTYIPNAAATHGNEIQDEMCDAARATNRPLNIRIPTGGPVVYATIDGYMVTKHISDVVRERLREQAVQAWRARPVQGKVATCRGRLFGPTMDIKAYTACNIPSRWDALLLPSDIGRTIDLSRVLYRAMRAVGGGWTEWQHSDNELAAFATAWCMESNQPPPRVCPLCRQQPGTPRHVIMSCDAMTVPQNAVRTIVENELRQWRQQQLIEGGMEWVASQQDRGLRFANPSPAQQAAWPILSAWRWLIPCPQHGAWLSPQVHTSTQGVAREHSADLGYRGTLPAPLGRLLIKLATSSHDVDNVEIEDTIVAERFATGQQHQLIEAEAAARSRALKRAEAPFAVTTALVLGIQKLRYVYAERVHAFRQLWVRARCNPSSTARQDDPPSPPKRARRNKRHLDPYVATASPSMGQHRQRQAHSTSDPLAATPS